MNGTKISVSQLNRYVKSVIDGDQNLRSLFVTGEISNYKLNSFSGHIYFTLKDGEAAVKAVMFKANASRLKFVPSEGMKVICSASVSLYERDGAYQIYVNDIQPDGVGSIAIALEQLKEKLEKEGLFDKALKKPIPSFPKKIAVITSETGAAVHDMINVLSRRWPIADIVICPVKVQGEDAPDQMCEAILDVNNYTDCDVIIIGRGGGSREDLWCFNDEKLARVISVSEIPVISAVGHETDFTICDFVADLRAPTPSAAAELAVPDINEILYYINTLSHTLKSNVDNFVERLEKHLSDIETNPVFLDRFVFLNNYEQLLDSLKSRLDSAAKMQLDIREFNLANTITKLDTLNPAKTLLRGFSIAEKDGKAISSVVSLGAGDSIKVKFSDGTVDCSINSVERKL